MQNIDLLAPPCNIYVYVYEVNGAKQRLDLDIALKDLDQIEYTITIPKVIIDISSSYIKGLFYDSVLALNTFEDFENKYHLIGNDEDIVEKIYKEVEFLYIKKSYYLEAKNKSKQNKSYSRTLRVGSIIFSILSGFGISRSMNYNDYILALSFLPLLSVSFLLYLGSVSVLHK